MGMTIDEARTELISGNPFTNKFAKALVVAIDNMHKYEKIEEIMKETHEGVIAKYKKIEEVLKDGNDNC